MPKKQSVPTPSGDNAPEGLTQEEKKAFNPDEFKERLTQEEKEWLDGYYRESYGNAYNDHYKNEYDKALEADFGDLIPVARKIKDNPDYRKKLARIAEDDELAKYLLEDAYDVYRPVAQVDPELKKEIDTLRNKTTEVESKLTKKEQDEWNAQYRSKRDREFNALANEVPDLKFTPENYNNKKDPAWKLAEHIVNIAEERTWKNWKNGVDKEVSYKEVWDEFCDLTNRREEAPPSVPASSSKSETKPTSRTQAPRNALETKQIVREKTMAILDKAGGLDGLLAAVASKRK